MKTTIAFVCGTISMLTALVIFVVGMTVGAEWERSNKERLSAKRYDYSGRSNKTE